MVGPRFVYPSVCGWTLGLLTVVNNAAMPTVSLLKEPPGTGGWMGEEGQVACVILSPPLVVSGWVHIQRPAFHSRVVQAPPPPPQAGTQVSGDKLCCWEPAMGRWRAVGLFASFTGSITVQLVTHCSGISDPR